MTLPPIARPAPRPLGSGGSLVLARLRRISSLSMVAVVVAAVALLTPSQT
ncbi:MAG: hypothetical protein ACRDQZ_18465 [Mycobacteriales bacterium]